MGIVLPVYNEEQGIEQTSIPGEGGGKQDGIGQRGEAASRYGIASVHFDAGPVAAADKTTGAMSDGLT